MEQSIYDRLYTPNSYGDEEKKTVIGKLRSYKDKLILQYKTKRSKRGSTACGLTIPHVKLNKTKLAIPLTLIVVGVLGIVFMSEIAQNILASRRYNFANIEDDIDVDVIEYVPNVDSVNAGPILSSVRVEPAKLDRMYADKLERIRVAEERKRREAEITRKASALDAFLARQGSPMAGQGRLIVETAEKCGFDYTDVLGISMKESGLGVAMNPNQKGTAFGFMDGIRGETWEQAIPRVMCAMGTKYTNRYGMTLTLAKAYGPKSWTNEEAQTWLSHVLRYKSMIPR